MISNFLNRLLSAFHDAGNRSAVPRQQSRSGTRERASPCLETLLPALDVHLTDACAGDSQAL